MDNAINTYYKQAQFSLAAYADLVSGTPNILELQNVGMGATQAAAFAQTYEVVDRYDGMVLTTYIDEFGITQQEMVQTGLSATIFKNRKKNRVGFTFRRLVRCRRYWKCEPDPIFLEEKNRDADDWRCWQTNSKPGSVPIISARIPRYRLFGRRGRQRQPDGRWRR